MSDVSAPEIAELMEGIKIETEGDAGLIINVKGINLKESQWELEGDGSLTIEIKGKGVTMDIEAGECDEAEQVIKKPVKTGSKARSSKGVVKGRGVLKGRVLKSKTSSGPRATPSVPTTSRPQTGCKPCAQANSAARKLGGTGRDQCSLYNNKTGALVCNQCGTKGINCTSV